MMAFNYLQRHLAPSSFKHFFPPHLTLEHKKPSDKVANLRQCPGEFSKFTFSNQFILDTSEAISCASERQSLFIFHSARPENKAHL